MQGKKELAYLSYNGKPKNLNQIRSSTGLGGGYCGDAYLIKLTDRFGKKVSMVYKIYKHAAVDVVHHKAENWNNVYKCIYGGKYKEYASARAILVEDKAVLITPYIESTPLCVYEDWPSIRERLKKDANKIMSDLFNPGNFRKLENGDILPIDFDLVAPAPPDDVENFNGCFDLCCCFLPHLYAKKADTITKIAWLGHAFNKGWSEAKMTKTLKKIYNKFGLDICLRDQIIEQVRKEITLSDSLEKRYVLLQLSNLLCRDTHYNSKVAEVLAIVNQWRIVLSAPIKEDCSYSQVDDSSNFSDTLCRLKLKPFIDGLIAELEMKASSEVKANYDEIDDTDRLKPW